MTTMVEKQHPKGTTAACFAGGAVEATRACAAKCTSDCTGIQVQARSPKNSNKPSSTVAACKEGEEYWQCETFGKKWLGYVRDTYPAKSSYYFFAAKGCADSIR